MKCYDYFIKFILKPILPCDYLRSALVFTPNFI